MARLGLAAEWPEPYGLAAPITLREAQGSAAKMGEAKKRFAAAVAGGGDGVSRLRREQDESRKRKQLAMHAATLDAIKSAGGSVPVTMEVTAEDANNLLLANLYVGQVADFLAELSDVGTKQPKQVRLADIPVEETPDKKAIVARSERQLMMANVAATIDFVLSCPGDNVDVCAGLWRLYEGLEYVEQTGRRFHAFEPDGAKAGGAGDSLKHITRKAAVSAALSAYMLSGLSEAQALEKVMVYVRRATPDHFGLPAHKELEPSTVGNWRVTLNKRRSESEEGLRRYDKWIQKLSALRRNDPTRLTPWADRLLYAVIYRQ